MLVIIVNSNLIFIVIYYQSEFTTSIIRRHLLALFNLPLGRDCPHRAVKTLGDAHDSKESQKQQQRMNAEWKLAKIALIVILLYVVSWSPYSCVALVAWAGYVCPAALLATPWLFLF